MLRRLGVRGKILAVLAVPMLVILVAGAFISDESLRDLQNARASAQIVDVLQAYLPLSRALETESVVSLTGGSMQDVEAARAATDAAMRSAGPAMAGINLAQFPAAISAPIDEVRQTIGTDIETVRNNVDNRARAQVIQSQYAHLADNQFVVVDAVAQTVSNRELAAYLSAYLKAARTSHNLVTELIDGHFLIASATDAPSAGNAFDELIAETELYRTEAIDAIDALKIPKVTLTRSDPTSTYTRIRTWLGTATTVAVANIDPTVFANEVNGQNERLDAVSGAVVDAAQVVARDAITVQEQRTLITIALAVVGAVLSVLVASAVAGTIIIPLRRLTAAAADVRDELPRLVQQVSIPGEGPEMELPHIPVTSNDEVGRLAAAFNAVNTQTIKVAQEQAVLRGSIAEMFVNVARRDQVLLNRQLSFIDSLERSEEDPQTLANLFRLDHLATRMRRNAESLLVLAGIDSGRRLRDALPLSDVVRTASSEIEQYDRVQLDLQADPHMLGFNALPAAHLLAELLENATVFSEPETPVMVTTGVSGDQVVVRILDLGLGMSETELAAANAKISSVSAGDVLGAQRLGLYVVGRIAQRLGAEVRILKSTQGPTGTETIVRFPAGLFQSSESSPMGGYGVPLSRSAESDAFDAPVVAEVDLAALTDGETEQGLPRRRAVEAPSGGAVEASPAVTGAGLPARGHKTFDEDNLVLPEAPSGNQWPEVHAGGAGWTPSVVSDDGSELPSRARAASARLNPARPAIPSASLRPVDPISPSAARDPVARAGMFADFRGRSATPSGLAAPAGPVAPRMVVPGLAADEPEQALTEAYDVNQARVAPTTMNVPSLADDGWVAPAVREPVTEPAAWTPPDVPQWQAPDMPQWQAPDEPLWSPTPDVPAVAVPAAWAAPVAEQVAEIVAEPVRSRGDVLAAPLNELWRAPDVDVEQWATADEQPPTFEPMPAPPLVEVPDGWFAPSADGVAAPTSYVPFERSADEARAWATGALPIVTAPPDFPAVVSEQEPADEWAAPNWQPPSWTAPSWLKTADAATEPVPAEQQSEAQSLAEEPAVTAWSGAPWTAGTESAAGSASAPVAAPVMDVQLEPDLEPVAAGPVPAPEAALDAQAAPEQDSAAQPSPAWAPQAAPVELAAPAFADLVNPSEREEKPRRGLFGRKKRRRVVAPPERVAVMATAAPAGAPGEAPAPMRTSAWSSSGDPVIMPEPEAAPTSAQPAGGPRRTWSVAPLSHERASVARFEPVRFVPGGPEVAEPPPPLPEARAPESLWTMSEWTPRAAPSQSFGPPQLIPRPNAAPRVGTLDDEVAAMLALRSDIQEQALSELSQLSAYRPRVVTGQDAEQLVKRVPVAIPEAPQFTETVAPGGERDPEKLRARLSSFQSGTVRGRRDADQDAGSS